FRAIRSKREPDGIGCVMRNSESVHVNVANREMLPGMNRLHPAQALSKSFRKNALHRVHGWLGDVQRRLPQPEHLRQSIAMIVVFVSDQDAVDLFDVAF